MLNESSLNTTRVSGKIRAIKKSIIVSDMEFGERITKDGLILLSDDGKERGIRPRWAKVFAIGPEQTDVEIGDWVLVEHGRWTRKVDYENDGEIKQIRMVDPKDVIGSQKDKPEDSYVADSITGTV